jgi:hypothetical protein
MNLRQKTACAIDPHWDGTRIAFQIEVGDQLVDCAISRSALQDLGGYRYHKAPDLLRAFTGAEARIVAAAAEKFAAGSESVYGVVSIWADDLEDAPQTETGPAGQAQGNQRHGKGSRSRQSRGQEAESQQEGGAGHVVVPAADAAAAAGEAR